MRYLATPWLIGCIDPMPETIFEFNTIFQSWGCKQRLNKSWMNLAGGLLGAGWGWLRVSHLPLKAVRVTEALGILSFAKPRSQGLGQFFGEHRASTCNQPACFMPRYAQRNSDQELVSWTKHSHSMSFSRWTPSFNLLPLHAPVQGLTRPRWRATSQRRNRSSPKRHLRKDQPEGSEAKPPSRKELFISGFVVGSSNDEFNSEWFPGKSYHSRFSQNTFQKT